MEKQSSQGEDSRFRLANFEALCSLALAGLYMVWWYGFAYHGTPADPDSYSYIMGMPSWFFFSVILGPFLFSCLAWIMVRCLFREVSLAPHEEDIIDE